jgi:hypothetical protein
MDSAVLVQSRWLRSTLTRSRPSMADLLNDAKYCVSWRTPRIDPGLAFESWYTSLLCQFCTSYDEIYSQASKLSRCGRYSELPKFQ